VFSLILLLLLLWFVLSGLLAAGTLFLQGYFNETPPQLNEVAWRAPAAGAGIAVFVTLWTFLYYNHPDSFAPLTEFSSAEDQPYFPKFWIVSQEGQRVEYSLGKGDQGREVYLSVIGRRPLPARPAEIIIKEDGAEAHFKPDREAQKRDPNKTLSYRDEKGRVMQEGYLGKLIPERRSGRTFVYFLLNLAHFGIWFACLWPLLRFSWGQALLLALACWLTMTLVIVPPILSQAGKVARARPPEEARREGLDKTEEGGPVGTSLLPGSVTQRFPSRPRYLAATVGVAKLISTLVSSPARTATDSVRVSVLPSRTTSAFSV
jgi:hypothetical protein